MSLIMHGMNAQIFSIISQKQQLCLENKSLKQRPNGAGVVQGYHIKYLHPCISKPGESLLYSCG